VLATRTCVHLNGGVLLGARRGADVAFFSFNDPDRTWINYYWASRPGVQGSRARGYQGSWSFEPPGIRGLVTICGHRRLPPAANAGLALLVLLAIYVVLVDGRAYQLRPHLVSYFFIPLFIYVLEHRPRLAPLLPSSRRVGQCHGVEWVVGALICGRIFRVSGGSPTRTVDPERGCVRAGITTCLPACC